MDEVARDLKVSTKTVYTELKSGRLKFAKIRGCIRIAADDLEEYWNKQRGGKWPAKDGEDEGNNQQD